MYLRHPLESKAFSPSRISYLRCYFQDPFTSISVVAAILPIMVRPNAILKFELVNIWGFHIPLEKRWRLTTKTVIQEHLLCCNYSPSYEEFFILAGESDDFKLNIMKSLLIAGDKPYLDKAYSFFAFRAILI